MKITIDTDKAKPAFKAGLGLVRWGLSTTLKATANVGNAIAEKLEESRQTPTATSQPLEGGES